MSIRPYKHNETLFSLLQSDIDEAPIGVFRNQKFPENTFIPPEIPEICRSAEHKPEIALRITFLKIYFGVVEEVVKRFADMPQDNHSKNRSNRKINLQSVFSEDIQNDLCKKWIDWLIITGSQYNSFPEPWGNFKTYFYYLIVSRKVSMLIEKFKEDVQNLASEIIRQYSASKYSMIFYSQISAKINIDVLLFDANNEIIAAVKQAEGAILNYLAKKQYLGEEK